jgi:hypothetical protein
MLLIAQAGDELASRRGLLDDAGVRRVKSLFAGIGCVLLCTVMQYATDVAEITQGKNNYLQGKARTFNPLVVGSIPRRRVVIHSIGRGTSLRTPDKLPEEPPTLFYVKLMWHEFRQRPEYTKVKPARRKSASGPFAAWGSKLVGRIYQQKVVDETDFSRISAGTKTPRGQS